MRRIVWFILLSFIMLAVWPAAAISKVKAHHVGISAMKYTPSALNVSVGDEIVWTNNDLVPHTVTAVDRAFDSGPMKPKATWKTQVKRSGKLEYICLYHPTMKGRVIVQ